MSDVLHRLLAQRTVGLVFAVAAATAACNAAGATATPTQPAAATAPPSASVPSATPAASGPTAVTTTTFGVPFSISIPAGWKVSVDEPDMFTVYVSTDPDTFDAAVDIQLVPKVHEDPCKKDAGDVTAGTTAADLVAWMLALAPLAGTAGAPTTIDGMPALVVDEAFAGTPCVNAELWPTTGGWLDATEHKRYFVFEVGGKRLVATIVSSDKKFATQADIGLAILESLHFTP